MKTKPRYEQLNVVTLIAMMMIFTIHYFNRYTEVITSNQLYTIASLLRGVALIAVPLFVANIGYTYIYLNKPVNYKKIFLYIVLPTLFLTQINLKITGDYTVFWNVEEGFSNSWFADMFIPLMLFVPLLQYLYNNSRLTKKILVGLSILGLIWAYTYSLENSATLLGMGIWVFIPYLPMLIVLTFFIFEIKMKHWLIPSVLFIISTLLISYGYYQVNNPEVPKLVVFNSYFGPLAIIASISLIYLIYHSEFELPYLRFVSRSSYFFYFTHHGVLKIYNLYFSEIVEAHILRFYVIGIIVSLILSTIAYAVYELVLNLLKIEQTQSLSFFKKKSREAELTSND